MIAVTIPTLNEKGSIGELLARLANLPIAIAYILIIDDGSTDGTIDAVKTLAQKYPQIHILQRSGPKGLGKAYLEGFKRVLSDTGTEIDVIIQMDADLSHDPEVIVDFARLIKEYDLVIGSRYIDGGNVSGWNWPRRMISRFGNLYARVALNSPIHDLTGGYKCWRRPLLEKIIATPLESLGYVFQIETTYRAASLNAHIKETPITFTERKTGGSKFSFKIIAEAYLKVLALRFGKNRLP